MNTLLKYRVILEPVRQNKGAVIVHLDDAPFDIAFNAAVDYNNTRGQTENYVARVSLATIPHLGA